MSIVNSYATGSVTGSGNNVGGLVGYVGSSSVYTTDPVYQSYATGKVTGANYVGGLVGYVGYIDNPFESNYATGNVSGKSSVGGLVGYEVQNYVGTNPLPTLVDNYSAGHVSGATAVGGLIGTDLSTVSDSYWNTTTSGQTTSAGGTPLTAAQMQNTANFVGFQFSNSRNVEWVMVDANGTLNNAGRAAGAVLPMLLSEYSTTITNAHQLQLMALNPTASYTLAQNIGASATGSGGDVWGAAGFVPIGTTAGAFGGSFNGAGYAVTNLTVNQPTANDSGLFGVTGKSAVVQNVGLIDASVTGSQLVGGLVGANGGSVVNSYATGSVGGAGNVGGLVGENLGTLSNVYATSTVTAERAVGGLVGWNVAGTIEDSYATGNVVGLCQRPGLGIECGGRPGGHQLVERCRRSRERQLLEHHDIGPQYVGGWWHRSDDGRDANRSEFPRVSFHDDPRPLGQQLGDRRCRRHLEQRGRCRRGNLAAARLGIFHEHRQWSSAAVGRDEFIGQLHLAEWSRSRRDGQPRRCLGQCGFRAFGDDRQSVPGAIQRKR
jgi:hypothetical protein